MVTSYPPSGSLWGWGWQCCGVWTHSSQKQESQNDVQGLQHGLFPRLHQIISRHNHEKTSMIIARSLIFQTNSSGQSYKDSKTRLKEMILDEHTEVSGRVVMIEVVAMMERRRWWFGMDPLHCQRCSRDKVFWRDKDLFARDRERDRESEPQREKLEHGPEKERKKERKKEKECEFC